MNHYDLYDVLANLRFGLALRTRTEHALAFTCRHEDWLKGLPTAQVQAAGGLAALQAGGHPADLLRETKGRMFAA